MSQLLPSLVQASSLEPLFLTILASSNAYARVVQARTLEPVEVAQRETDYVDALNNFDGWCK